MKEETKEKTEPQPGGEEKDYKADQHPLQNIAKSTVAKTIGRHQNLAKPDEGQMEV